MAQWIKIQLANAGHIGSKPGPRIPSAVDKLSPCTQSLSPRAATTEACVVAHALQHEKPLQWEAHALQLKSSRNSLQLGKAHAQQQSPREAINKPIFFFLKMNRLGIPWRSTVARVQSLVGELKSLKLYGTAKKMF